jgi:hypothetical protein
VHAANAQLTLSLPLRLELARERPAPHGPNHGRRGRRVERPRAPGRAELTLNGERARTQPRAVIEALKKEYAAILIWLTGSC